MLAASHAHATHARLLLPPHADAHTQTKKGAGKDAAHPGHRRPRLHRSVHAHPHGWDGRSHARRPTTDRPTRHTRPPLTTPTATQRNNTNQNTKKQKNKTGSHTVVALLDAGHTVTVVDNLSNSFLRVLDHVNRIVGPEKAAKITFAQVRESVCAGGGDRLADGRFGGGPRRSGGSSVSHTHRHQPPRQTKKNTHRSTCATARRSTRSLWRTSE
jgi:hypothetical protein